MANHTASTSQLPEFWTRNQNITKILSMSSETILTRKCEMNVYANMLQSLQPPNWLNDDAIVLYMKLIANEVIVFQFLSKQLDKTSGISLVSSYFGKGISNSITMYTKWIAVPICDGIHWTLMMINIQERKFFYLNSLVRRVALHKMKIKRFFESLLKVKWKEDVKLKECHIENLPQQTNGYDCGAYIARFFKHIVLDIPMTFTAADMMDFRLEMFETIYPEYLINTEEEKLNVYEEEMETDTTEGDEQDTNDDIIYLRDLARKSTQVLIATETEMDHSKELMDDSKPKEEMDDFKQQIDNSEEKLDESNEEEYDYLEAENIQVQDRTI